MEKREKEAISKALLVFLWTIYIIIEAVLTITLLVLNGLPAIQRGYWSFFWIFFVAWAAGSIILTVVMSSIIRTKRRQKLTRDLRKSWTL